IGADALRDEVGLVVGLRVTRPRAAVGAHRDAGHGLNATADDELVPARAHLLRGHVDRLKAGRAEPVDLHAADGVGQPGADGRGLGDIRALVTDRGDHAQNDVLDPVRVEVGVPPAQLVDEPDDQRDWFDAMQRAGLLATATRRPDRVVYKGFGAHETWSSRTTASYSERATSSFMISLEPA